MSMRIEARPALEAYISKKGLICIKQDNPEIREDAIIAIPPEDVEQVIGWLQTLLEERNSMPNEQFEQDDEDDEDDEELRTICYTVPSKAAPWTNCRNSTRPLVQYSKSWRTAKRFITANLSRRFGENSLPTYLPSF